MSLYDACHAAGGMTAFEWDRDPKRLAFILARYKFVAKMLAGYGRVLEVGCADGFGSRIVAQFVGQLTAIDVERESIEAARRNAPKNWTIHFGTRDFFEEWPIGTRWDAVYALDVLEHVEPESEGRFLGTMSRLAPVALVGCPSLESQPHASELSKLGHVNCKTEGALRGSMLAHFRHVFLFGMNDETLHTGFGPMCHYRFAIGVN